MMDTRDFLNRIRGLYNIDPWQLPELDDHQWLEFVRDPPRYLMRADDRIAEAICRQIEARQRPVVKEPA